MSIMSLTIPPPSRSLARLPRAFPRPSPAISTSWTCRRCISTTPPRSAPATLSRLRAKVRRRGIYAAIGVTAFAGATAVGYLDGKHYVKAAERAWSVGKCLALCIYDYRTTLDKLETTDDDEMLSRCHSRCAKRTFKVLEKNGSIFIKLGQHLAAMGYLLPLEWTTTFVPLQDRCPVSSIESIEKMILDDTGHTIDELFEYFDPVPLGAASLAQVHRARLKDTGQEVAVKMQHPALAEWIPLDMSLTRWAFTNVRYFFPEYPLLWLSDEMESSLPQELDFEWEAHNIRRVSDYFNKNFPNLPLVIPKVMWAKKRILCMEYMPGKRLDDLEYLDTNKISRDDVSASLARIFNAMIFGKGAPLHCDPHGGNLAIRKNPNRRKPHSFDIILYDHGLYRDIPEDLRRSYAKLWLAVLDGDMDAMRIHANAVAGVTDEQFPLFASAITGRDWSVLQKGVATPRSAEEKSEISTSLTEGLLAQLIQMLNSVPSVILLILKTNDLTRSLDESLKTGRGPERSFLIMAKYCSSAVYEETIEIINRTGGLLRDGNFLKWLGALWHYWRIGLKLRVFETAIYAKGVLGLEA